MRHYLALAILWGGLLVPATAAAERIGIVVVAAVNIGEGEAQQLAANLGTALGERLAIDVVAGQTAAERLPPDGVSELCVADIACIRKVAAQLDVDQLLLVAIIRVGARIQLDTTWIDIPTGRTESRDRIQLEHGGIRTAGDVFREAAPRLLPAAPVRQRVQQRPEGRPGEPGPGPAPETAAVTPLALESGQIQPGPLNSRWFWFSAGASAVVLVAGGIVGLNAFSDYRRLQRMGCDSRRCDRADIDLVENQAVIADILLGVGTLAGLTTSILYLALDESDPAVNLAPIGNGMTVTFGGRF